MRVAGRCSSSEAAGPGDRTDGTQMIDWALDAFSKELLWALVIVAVIAVVAVVSLLKK
jgi:hypothetical protein